MSSKVQISKTTFIRVMLLLDKLNEYDLDFNTQELVNELLEDVDTKIEAIQKREAYTDYRSGSTPQQRESARQKYLDLAGIPEDFRYSRNSENKN